MANAFAMVTRCTERQQEPLVVLVNVENTGVRVDDEATRLVALTVSLPPEYPAPSQSCEAQIGEPERA